MRETSGQELPELRNGVCESGGQWNRKLSTARNTIPIFGIFAPIVRIGRLRILTPPIAALHRPVNFVVNVSISNTKERASSLKEHSQMHRLLARRS
jgi:hypothetical protein